MPFPTALFVTLWALGVFGVITVIPYQYSVIAHRLHEITMPLARLAVLIVIQGAVFMAIITVVGLVASRAVGLSTPVLDALLAGQAVQVDGLLIGGVMGVVGSLALFALERIFFLSAVPDALLALPGRTAAWKRALACFYGGFTEEIIVRLFFMSGIIWLVTRITPPTDGVYWLAIIAAALAFGALHLPTTALLVTLTPQLVVRGLALNGIVGLICAGAERYCRADLRLAVLALRAGSGDGVPSDC
jgi:hypothetical protein